MFQQDISSLTEVFPGICAARATSPLLPTYPFDFVLFFAISKSGKRMECTTVSSMVLRRALICLSLLPCQSLSLGMN